MAVALKVFSLYSLLCSNFIPARIITVLHQHYIIHAEQQQTGQDPNKTQLPETNLHARGPHAPHGGRAIGQRTCASHVAGHPATCECVECYRGSSPAWPGRRVLVRRALFSPPSCACAWSAVGQAGRFRACCVCCHVVRKASLGRASRVGEATICRPCRYPRVGTRSPEAHTVLPAWLRPRRVRGPRPQSGRLWTRNGAGRSL